MSKNDKDYCENLAALFTAVGSKAEMTELLNDMFTPAERKDFWERWCIVDLLLRGNSQRETKEKLKVSISKVTRGSRELQYGTGAFRRLWDRLNRK
jgi:TrpR family trp operon transcriptional repressor